MMRYEEPLYILVSTLYLIFADFTMENEKSKIFERGWALSSCLCRID